MNKAINLIFPNQLFAESSLLHNSCEIYLIEEYLFFKQYSFHKQKIAFHRASMKAYQAMLEEKGKKINYISANDQLADIRNFETEILLKNITGINLIDPVDEWLLKRLRKVSKNCNLNIRESPQFLNTNNELVSFFRTDKTFYFQTSFYKEQREKLNILMDEENKPLGGKLTFDDENRKKYPKNKTAPAIHYPEINSFWKDAVEYTDKHFSNNPGKVNTQPIFPTTHIDAEKWLIQFLEYRFFDFGAYEDSIVKEESFLHHSVLSPLLNSGLLTPEYVLQQTLSFAQAEKIPLNSVEGFVRQIIGWREFMRGIYLIRGNYSRTKNFWGFTRKIPSCFYDGTTGIVPIDETIKKVLITGYCHHIERLMVLGNFMLLCEFDPDEVYKWFMELFIDAYDWVMVPNIYGMSQFADGGVFATKPYIGGSNYIKKMSNYTGGEWEATWDGLFWQFIHKQQDFFKSNYRTSMMYHSVQKMDAQKLKLHLENAERFVKNKLT